MRITLIVLISNTWGVDGGGKCTNEEIGLWRGNYEFAASMEKYAKRGIGRGSYVASHLVEEFRPNLSEQCASCHGQMITCMSKTCWWPCMSSSSAPNCLVCSRTNCQEAYMECVGTNDEQDLPPKPTGEPVTTISPTTTIHGRRLDESTLSTTETPVRTLTSTLPTLLPLDIELWETIENPEEQ